jgi:hypothetical protein
MKFAGRYARIETEISGITLNLDQWNFFGYFMGETWLWGTVWLGLAGLAVALFTPRWDLSRLLIAWVLALVIFKIVLFTTPEVRHFMFIFPALAALAAVPLTRLNRTAAQRAVVWTAAVLALGANVFAWQQIPVGIVGYGPVARQLASLDRPGNIFMACWHDQDLIFHYRSAAPHHDRLLIRSDRTFAIRLADYAERPVEPIVKNADDALETMKKGRIRYVVTTTSSLPGFDNRPYDFVLAEEMIRKHAPHFTKRGEGALSWQFGPGQHAASVTLWEYTGELPAGPSELKLVVPTADIVIDPVK